MLPHRYKPIGSVLVLIGLGLAIFYSLHKIDISVPVFAIHSSYLETKYFAIIKNNIFEELIILFFITGFILTAFSKERLETEMYRKIRGEAWQAAVLLNSAILIFATLFIYGTGFMMLLIYNLFSIFIFFHLFYWLKKRKLSRPAAGNDPEHD